MITKRLDERLSSFFMDKYKFRILLPKLILITVNVSNHKRDTFEIYY